MRYFVDRRFTIKRLRRIGSTDRSVISATATAVWGHKQNLVPEKSQYQDGLIGKEYRVWVPLAELKIPNLKPADKLVDEDDSNKVYTVQSVKTVDFGSIEYVQADVVQEDEA